MRATAVLVFMAFLTAASSRAAGLPSYNDPCPAPSSYFPNAVAVTAAPGTSVVVRFHVAIATSETTWAGIGDHDTVVGGHAERQTLAAFIERADDGVRVGTLGFSGYPYAAGLDVAGGSFVVAGPSAICGGLAVGDSIPYAPSQEYRVVFAVASEVSDESALYLPAGAVVDSVAITSAHVLDEESLACSVKLRVNTIAAGTEHLENCHASWNISDQAYFFVSQGAFWNSDHVSYLNGPSSSTRIFFTYGSGPAGAWSLDVPRYVTPASSGFGTPVASLGGDAGIFGVLADVPN